MTFDPIAFAEGKKSEFNPAAFAAGANKFDPVAFGGSDIPQAEQLETVLAPNDLDGLSEVGSMYSPYGMGGGSGIVHKEAPQQKEQIVLSPETQETIDNYNPYGITNFDHPDGWKIATDLAKQKQELDSEKMQVTYDLPDELRAQVSTEKAKRYKAYHDALSKAPMEVQEAARRDELFKESKRLQKSLQHFESQPDDDPTKSKLLSEWDELNDELNLTDNSFKKRVLSGRATKNIDHARYGKWSVNQSQQIAEALAGGNVRQIQSLFDEKNEVERVAGETLPQATSRLGKAGQGALGSLAPMGESIALGLVTAGTADKAYWMRAGTGEIFSMWLAQDGRKVVDIPKEELDKAKAISQVGGALYGAVEYASGLVPGLKQTGVSWGDVVMKKLLKEAWDNPALMNKLMRGGVRAVFNWLGETAEEGGQNAVSKAAVSLIEDGHIDVVEDVAKPFLEGAWEAKDVTAIMALTGISVSGVASLKKKGGILADTVPAPEAQAKPTEKVVQEGVTTPEGRPVTIIEDVKVDEQGQPISTEQPAVSDKRTFIRNDGKATIEGDFVEETKTEITIRMPDGKPHLLQKKFWNEDGAVADKESSSAEATKEEFPSPATGVKQEISAKKGPAPEASGQTKAGQEPFEYAEDIQYSLDQVDKGDLSAFDFAAEMDGYAEDSPAIADAIEKYRDAVEQDRSDVGDYEDGFIFTIRKVAGLSVAQEQLIQEPAESEQVEKDVPAKAEKEAVSTPTTYRTIAEARKATGATSNRIEGTHGKYTVREKGEKFTAKKSKQAETPAAAIAEVKQEMSNPSNKVAQRDPKDIKNDIIAQLKEAIAKAPTNEELAARTEENADATDDFIEFSIPGDGTFKIVNTKENIEKVLKRAKQLTSKTKSPAERQSYGSGGGMSQSALVGAMVSSKDAIADFEKQIRNGIYKENDVKKVESAVAEARELLEANDGNPITNLKEHEKTLANAAEEARKIAFEKVRNKRYAAGLSKLKSHPKHKELKRAIAGNDTASKTVPKDGNLLAAEARGQYSVAVKKLQKEIAADLGLKPIPNTRRNQDDYRRDRGPKPGSVALDRYSNTFDKSQSSPTVEEQAKSAKRKPLSEVMGEEAAKSLEALKHDERGGFLTFGKDDKSKVFVRNADGTETEVVGNSDVAKTLKAGRRLAETKISKTIEGVKDYVDTIDKSFVHLNPELNEFPQFKDDRRTELMPLKRKIGDDLTTYRLATFGLLEKREGKIGINKAIDLFYTRDLIQRARDGIKLPNDLSLQEVESHLDHLEKSASDNVKRSAQMMKSIMEAQGNELVERGKLTEHREDYAHHEVLDYVPAWLKGTKVSMQHKFHDPFRSYTKKAVGTAKLIRTDEDGFWSHVAKVEMDNRLEDWQLKQAEKYDKKAEWVEREKAAGKKSPTMRKGQIVTIGGKRFKAIEWKKTSFIETAVNRTFLEEAIADDMRITEFLEMRGANGGKPLKNVRVMGKAKLFLLPEKIADSLTSLEDSSDALWDVLWIGGRMTKHWKSLTLTAAGAPYQIGNIMGDTLNMLLFDPGAAIYTKDAWAISGELFFPRTARSARQATTGEKELSDFQKRVMKVAAEKDVANSGMYSEIAHFGLIERGRGVWHHANEFREALARIAILAHQLDRVEKGRDVQKVAGINTDGLDPESAAAKLAREALVDYVAVPRTYRRLLSGLATPFIRFHEANLRNHVRAATNGTAGAKYLLRVATPYLAAWLFNNGDDERKEAEGQLPDWIRNRWHVNLGETEEGTYRVWAPQQPVDMAMSWVGFDNVGRILSDVTAKRITPKQAAEEFAIKVLKAPGESVQSLMNPLLQFIQGMVSNKDPFTQRKIMPDSVHSNLKDADLKTLKYAAPYVIGYLGEKLITPIAQFTRTKKGGNPEKNPVWAYLKDGPLNFKRAIGIYDIDLSSGEVSEVFDDASKKKMTYEYWKARVHTDLFSSHGKGWEISKIHLSFIQDMEEAGVKNPADQIRKWSNKNKGKLAMFGHDLRQTKDETMRSLIREQMAEVRQDMAEDYQKSVPKSVR